ncbi:hypothetical protein [Pseudomonas sp. 8 R 14]|nr:hypothetical protein [Pseudomonas sp. 8 R 14]
MSLSEVRVQIHDFRRRLTNDDQTHDHCLLSTPVFQKLFFAKALYKTYRVSSGLPYVIQIIPEAICCHTGRASASTFARNFNGKSAGVSRSTLTPSRSSSSTCSPPRSNKVVPGGASTSKSRSLPSWSVPSNTDPNTLGFEMRNRPTTSLTAARFRSRAVEGFTVHLSDVHYRASLAALAKRRHVLLITPLSSFRHIALLPSCEISCNISPARTPRNE